MSTKQTLILYALVFAVAGLGLAVGYFGAKFLLPAAVVLALACIFRRPGSIYGAFLALRHSRRG